MSLPHFPPDNDKIGGTYFSLFLGNNVLANWPPNVLVRTFTYIRMFRWS